MKRLMLASLLLGVVAYARFGRRAENVMMLSGVEGKMPTPLGEVTVATYGTGPKLALAFHGAAAGLVGEWGGIAEQLGAHGYKVIVPNLHSNHATKPGVMSAEDFQRVALALAGGSPALWLGKSWGGANVAGLVAAHPKAVEKVVLDAPAAGAAAIEATCTTLNASGAPLLLLWAEDDKVIPFSPNSEIWMSKCKHATLKTTPSGGHRIITSEYAGSVLAFAARATA